MFIIQRLHTVNNKINYSLDLAFVRMMEKKTDNKRVSDEALTLKHVFDEAVWEVLTLQEDTSSALGLDTPTQLFRGGGGGGGG